MWSRSPLYQAQARRRRAFDKSAHIQLLAHPVPPIYAQDELEYFWDAKLYKKQSLGR